MPELNSTGTATRAWAAGDELVAVAEGGASPDALARLSSLPQSFIDGLVAAIAAKVASDPTGITGAFAVSNMVYMTAAAYDALPRTDPDTVYVLI